LKRHEINGNYYAKKKIRSKIKAALSPLGKRHAIADRKLAERKTGRVAGVEGEN